MAGVSHMMVDYKRKIHSHNMARNTPSDFTANWHNIIDQSQAGCGSAEPIGREVLSVTKNEF